MEMMLYYKQSQVIFLLEFKMGHNAAKTTHNMNNASGQGTANECTVQWWVKKFCKGDESLEDEDNSGCPPEVDKNQLKASLKPILLQLHEKLQRTQRHHSIVIQHVKQIGQVKKLDKGVPHELTKNLK